MVLGIAFWNLHNLVAPGVRDSGPATPQELSQRIGVAADVMAEFFAGSGPDLCGVAEVGSEAILRALSEALGERLSRRYDQLWEDRRTGLFGLGVLCRRGVASVERLDAYAEGARPWCLVSRCTLSAGGASFVFAVNHWKSRLGPGGVGGADPTGDADRLSAAVWLAQRLAALDQPSVVASDFNWEPHEAPFTRWRLRGERHLSVPVHGRTYPRAYYNTAWRYLPEARYADQALPAEMAHTWPITTWDDARAIFDQLLVSREILQGVPMRLLESRGGYHCGPANARLSAAGRICARPWDGTAGASDHLPIVAQFEY